MQRARGQRSQWGQGWVKVWGQGWGQHWGWGGSGLGAALGSWWGQGGVRVWGRGAALPGPGPTAQGPRSWHAWPGCAWGCCGGVAEPPRPAAPEQGPGGRGTLGHRMAPSSGSLPPLPGQPELLRLASSQPEQVNAPDLTANQMAWTFWGGLSHMIPLSPPGRCTSGSGSVPSSPGKRGFATWTPRPWLLRARRYWHSPLSFFCDIGS